MKTHPRLIILVAILSLPVIFTCNPTGRIAKDLSTSLVVEGNTAGHFSVDKNGAANYALSIDVPPGINNVQPQLSLAYNSSGKNGIFGVGWTLNGLEGITRTSVRPEPDGFRAPIAYGENDRWSFKGQRLVPQNSSGPYYTPQTVYHTEIESWQKVVAGEALNGGPANFTAWNKKGWVSKYGFASGQRQHQVNIPSGSNNYVKVVEAWYPDTLMDHNSNYLIVEWENGGNMHRPTQIGYGGNLKAGVPCNRFVTFKYEQRDDWVQNCIAGVCHAQDFRLTRISTFVGEAPTDENFVKAYEIKYEYSSRTARSLVTSIQECGWDPLKNTVVCLPPSKFSYQMPNSAVDIQEPDTFARKCVTSEIWMADLNADGLQDLLYRLKDSTSLFVRLSEGDNFGPDQRWGDMGHTQLNQSWQADLNADGRSDFIFTLKPDSDNRDLDENEIHVMLAGETGFDAPQVWCKMESNPLADGTGKWFSDFNGDGRSDFLYQSKNNKKKNFYLFLSDGKSFGQEKEWAKLKETPDEQWVTDVNGDGMTDYLYKIAYKSGNGIPTNASYRCVLSQMSIDGTFLGGAGETNWFTAQHGSDKTFFSDMNGDGLSDLVEYTTNGISTCQLRVSLNSGAPESYSGSRIIYFSDKIKQNPPGPNNTWLTDVNGDGAPDFVFKRQEGAKYYLYVKKTLKGGREMTGAEIWMGLKDNASTRWCQDLNGDGLGDYLYIKDAGHSKKAAVATLNRGPVPDLLNTITNGLNGQYAVDYLPLTNPEVYHATTDTGNVQSYFSAAENYPYPEEKADNAMHLVRRYAEKDGRGNDHIFEYEYVNGAMDQLGRGWEGFAEVIHRDMNTGNIERTFYAQGFPYTGKITGILSNGDPAKDTLLQSETALLGSTRHDYECIDARTGQPCSETTTVFSVQMNASQIDHYTYGIWDFSIGHAFQHDQFGNVIFETDQGTVDLDGEDLLEGDNVYTYESYLNDTVDWAIGLPLNVLISARRDVNGIERLSAQSPPDFSPEKDFSCTLKDWDERKNQVLDAHWDDQNEVWLTSTYGYDEYGNKNKITSPAGQVTEVIFDSEYHSYRDSMVQTVDAAGKTMATHYGFDPGTGKLIAVAPPSGDIRFRYYDPFGRPEETQCLKPAGTHGSPSTNDIQNYLLTGSNGTDWRSLKMFTLTRTSMEKDEAGRIYLLKQSSYDWNPEVEMRWQRSYLDGQGKKYATVMQGNSPAANIAVVTDFTADDHPLRHSYPFLTSEQFASTTDAKAWTEYEYDIYRRPTRVTKPADNGGTTVNLYTYPTSNSKEVEYDAGSPDAFSKYVTSKTYRGNEKTVKINIPARDESTTFNYDRIGRPTKVTDPGGIAMEIAYDSQDHLVSEQDPNRGHAVHHYGIHGKIDYSVDGLGDTLRYEYDLLSRLTTLKLPDGSAYDYIHDEEVLPGVSSNTESRLSSVRHRNRDGKVDNQYVYGYDELGNRTTSQLTLIGTDNQPHSYTSRMRFDPLKRISGVTNPDNSEINLHQSIYLDSMRIGDAGIVWSDYDAFGEAGSEAYSNGLKNIRTHSEAGLEKYIAVLDAAGATLYEDNLLWDGMERPKSIRDGVDAKNDVEFTYEVPGRLKKADSKQYGAVNFGYDKAGNLNQVNDETLSYDAHKVVSATGGESAATQFSYDQKGNLNTRQAEGLITYTFDPLNRMIRVNSEGATTHFQYGHHGHRISKTDPNGTQTLYISPFFELTISGTDTLKTAYLVHGHRKLASVSSGPAIKGPGIPEPGTLWFHHDHLGSTVMTSDDAQAVNRIQYQPFGAMESMSGTDNFRYKFGGKEWDHSVQLYYFTARYYDPQTRRFISADSKLGGPSGSADIYNRYAFALNNPTTYQDPSGHNAWKKFWHKTTKVVGSVAKFSLNVVEDPIKAGKEFVHFANSKEGKLIISITINTLEIAGGAALEPFCSVCGNTLIGAGVGGMLYDVTHINNFSWTGYAAAQATGAISGAMGPATSALTEAAGGGALAAVGIAVGMGAAGSVASRFTENAILGRKLESGLAGAAIMGAVGGLVTGSVGAAFKNVGEAEGFSEAGKKYFEKGIDKGVEFGQDQMMNYLY